MNNKVSYLVLDYNRPVESRLCLESLKENTKFECPVIYLSNGGAQDYVWDFYKEGLIDKLILNKENEGLGFGTTDLFKICKSTWAIYVQCDQYLGREYTEEELDRQKQTMKYSFNKELLNTSVASVSLVGDQCQGKYSERAHLIETQFYNSILNKPNGGAGPYHHLEWNEGFVQKYYEKNGLKHYIWPEPLFGDNGKNSFRTNPDKSCWRHFTDEKKTWLLSGPVKEKYVYPPFSDEQWDQILKEQKCEAMIPDGWKNDCFKVWL